MVELEEFEPPFHNVDGVAVLRHQELAKVYRCAIKQAQAPEEVLKYQSILATVMSGTSVPIP